MCGVNGKCVRSSVNGFKALNSNAHFHPKTLRDWHYWKTTHNRNNKCKIIPQIGNTRKVTCNDLSSLDGR